MVAPSHYTAKPSALATLAACPAAFHILSSPMHPDGWIFPIVLMSEIDAQKICVHKFFVHLSHSLVVFYMTQSTLFEHSPQKWECRGRQPFAGVWGVPKNSCFSFCRSPQATCKEERRDQGTPLKPRSGAAAPNNPASQAVRG